MTANRGLFVRNNGTVGTTPIEGRLVLASLVAENAPGVPRQGLLDQKATVVVAGTASTSPMSYDVSAITTVINRAANEGVYINTLTGTSNVATTAAPGTGSRYDLIYVKQNDTDKGDADNTAVLAVLQGTASAGTPTKPYASLPAGAYVLAEALVNTGATATNGAQVTITQVWRYTALRGNPIPVRNTTERAEITTPTNGLQVIRLDLDANREALETYRSGTWTPVQRPVKHIIPENSALTGNASGLQAKVASGEVQLIHYVATVVVTTDAQGYAGIDYPVPFPNGVLSINICSGDSSIDRSVGGLTVSIAGAPFVSTNLTTMYLSALKFNGAGYTGALRVNIDVWGW